MQGDRDIQARRQGICLNQMTQDRNCFLGIRLLHRFVLALNQNNIFSRHYSLFGRRGNSRLVFYCRRIKHTTSSLCDPIVFDIECLKDCTEKSPVSKPHMIRRDGSSRCPECPTLLHIVQRKTVPTSSQSVTNNHLESSHITVLDTCLPINQISTVLQWPRFPARYSKKQHYTHY